MRVTKTEIQTDYQEVIDDLIKDLEVGLRKEASQRSEEAKADKNVVDYPMYADTPCDRCPTILGPRDEKCPNCKRAVDGSH